MSSTRKRLVPKEISPPLALVVNDDDDEKEVDIAQQSDDEPDVDAM